MSEACAELPVEIRDVREDAEAAACYALMRELRPHLASEAAFIEQWRRQKTAGYRLWALWNDGAPITLAGFRIQDNLVHGLHLYVDDLITGETGRGKGYGQQVLARVY